MTTPFSGPGAGNAAAPGSLADAEALTGAEVPPLDCALADKYRRRLALLPHEYRAVHGAEMVQVFLESARDADPENADLTYRLGSPGWRETSALVALALRLRWAPPADESRFAARAAGLRLFTSAVVVLLAALSLQQTVSAIALLIRPPADWEQYSLGVSIWQTLVPTDNWWLLLQSWAHLAWIAALVLLGRGSRVSLRVAALLAVVPTAVLAMRIVSDIVQFGTHGIASATGWLAVDVAAVVGLVAVASYAGSARHMPGEFAQPRRLQRHLIATGLAAALGIASIVTAAALRLPIAAYFIAIPITDMPTFFSLVSVVAAAVALARRTLPQPAAYALAGLAAAAAILQATTLSMWIDIARIHDTTAPPYTPWGRVGLVMAITALALDVLIAVIAAALARRAGSFPGR